MHIDPAIYLIQGRRNTHQTGYSKNYLKILYSYNYILYFVGDRVTFIGIRNFCFISIRRIRKSVNNKKYDICMYDVRSCKKK